MERSSMDVPGEQEAICANCIHPTGTFVEFAKEEIEQSIPDRFEKIVRRHPDRVAIASGEHRFTYEALNRIANRIARAILTRRGSQEEPIALLLETDAPVIAATLGALKAGKIYVPLDCSLPRARLAYILENAQAALLLTNSKNLGFARELSHEEIPLINIDEIDLSLSTDDPGISLSPDALAWIIYTSGSTGQPKGVVQSHRNALHFVRTYTNGQHICPDDRLTLLFSFSANGAAHDMFSALLNGASLYPYNVREQGPAPMADWLIQNHITLYCSVPTVFRHFLETLTGAETFPCLRLIKLIGEPVSKSDVELYQKHFSPECRLINRLGSSETGTIRWYFMDKKIRIDGNIVPVGYAVADNEILLLDDTGREIQSEGVGEIAVKSRYLTPGYWRRLDLTAAAFLPAAGDERIYRTGDIGRMLSDGRLLCLGRKDSQVKIRGHRVELTEIEMALMGLKSIKDAVVVGGSNSFNKDGIIAYLVPKENARPTVTQLRRALVEILPAHMIPLYYVFLPEFPLAPNGKLDRKALPEPDYSRPELETPYVAPSTPLEKELAGMWAALLGLDRVGIHDNFFELGGHSLLAVRLFAQIEKTFAKRLSLAMLLRAPTIEELAGMLRQEGLLASGSPLAVLQPHGNKPPFFWIHGENSNAFLPRYLGVDQPLYGLLHQSREDGKPARYTRIEEIAAYYSQDLRVVQSEGPYFLGGYCVGGLIAFEVAQQLRTQGQEIALLVLLDPANPRSTGRSNRSADSRDTNSLPENGGTRNRLGRHLHKLPPLDPRGKATQVLAIVKEKGYEGRKIVTQAFSNFAGRVAPAAMAIAKRVAGEFYFLTGFQPIPFSVVNFYSDAMYRRAIRAYRAEVYPGRIIILKTDDRKLDYRLGFERLAGGGLEIRKVVGKHAEIVFGEAQIQGLAEHLNACLVAAQMKTTVHQP